MNATSQALAGGVTIADRFRLVRPLSSGGMGSVWVATHTTLGTEVAIKFIDIRAESKEALLRFEREANVVARLRSPHVVQILDYGVDEAGRPYLAMELLNGESLKKRLDQAKVLPLSEVASIVVQICKALQRAHRAGVVHRDIKPANIFLTEEDDVLHVKVLDFGVAKASQARAGDSDAQKTETGAIVGTPAYMSPEQVLGSDEIDGRSDLFSLGVLAWRMLVGLNPHERDGKSLGLGELLIQIATKPVPPPSQFVAGIPPEVDAWFERTLALNASGRFASAKEMANAFARATQMPLPSSTGAFTVLSADASGAHAIEDPISLQDSDDAQVPIEVSALRERAEGGEAAAGQRAVARSSSAPTTPPPERRRARTWVVVGAALLLVAAFFALRRPTGASAPMASTAPVAESTPVPADPAGGSAASAAPSSLAAASADSSAAPAAASATPPSPQTPQTPPVPPAARSHVAPRAAPATPAPPKLDPPKKPSSTNTLLDDRL